MSPPSDTVRYDPFVSLCHSLLCNELLPCQLLLQLIQCGSCITSKKKKTPQWTCYNQSKVLTWAQSKNIARQCVTAATSKHWLLWLHCILVSWCFCQWWNSHLCHELFPVWLLNIGAQARAPGFWDGGIKTWCLHLSFRQFNTFLKLLLNKS